MGDLLIPDLDEAVLSALRTAAELRGVPVEEVAREALMAAAAPAGRNAWLEQMRAMRLTLPADQRLDTVALLRAEREARGARILGDDDAAAWAAAYRTASRATS